MEPWKCPWHNYAECREMQAFMSDPVASVHRFRVRQERRNHLEGKIAAHGLEMKAVTDRTGSPQTLVCTKNRDIHASPDGLAPKRQAR